MRLFFFLYYIFIFFHLSFQSTFVSLKICISNTLFISSLCVGGMSVYPHACHALSRHVEIVCCLVCFDFRFKYLDIFKSGSRQRQKSWICFSVNWVWEVAFNRSGFNMRRRHIFLHQLAAATGATDYSKSSDVDKKPLNLSENFIQYKLLANNFNSWYTWKILDPHYILLVYYKVRKHEVLRSLLISQ